MRQARMPAIALHLPPHADHELFGVASFLEDSVSSASAEFCPIRAP
ncbi:MAG: hypothetical protein H0V83_14960 [Rubrobacter sp.]|nr:hypothetical protein [Rubrobacter sp.]